MAPRSYTTPRGVTLTFEKALGRGQFGIANAVKNRKGDLFCMKEVSVRTTDEEAKAEVLREVQMMRETCQHVNVVTFYDSWFERNRLCILMEYCGNGSLDALIARFASSRKTFPYQKVVHYMQELSGALAYCHHTLRIMHRDLKPANVLVDDIGTLKLGDFGLAKELDARTDMCATFCGSPLYMSPELCSGQPYSFSSDVWALGCISFELMALTSPWADDTTLKSYPALVSRICQARPNYASIPGEYPSTLIDLTRWMLRKETSQRASSKEISDHLDIRSPPRSFEASVAPPVAAASVDVSRPPSPILDVTDAARDDTLVRQEDIVLAAKCIQRSFRVSAERRRLRRNCAVAPGAGAAPPLTPMDRLPPAVPPRRNKYAAPSEDSLAKVHRRAPCTDRLTRLAEPRTPPRLAAPVPTFRRMAIQARKPSPVAAPLLTPRPAWV